MIDRMTIPSPMSVDAPSPSHGATAAMPAEHRQFDFWIGNWDVFGPNGDVVGSNRIELVSDGYAIAERWEGTSGSRGVSHNAWDPGSRLWRQFWVGNTSGDVLYLEGSVVDGRMVLQGARPGSVTGNPQLQRISWTPNVDGTVRQHWQQSDDDGVTWITAFD